ncbi:MAG: transcription antitermination factor NusB [Verrucomicrobiales bacterium]
MGKRREGREAALQFLFSHDLNTRFDDRDTEAFWVLRRTSPSVRAFAEELIAGVGAQQEKLDLLIAPALDNFDIERVSAVERNILRIAVFEMLNLQEIPAAVTINEAIEIAKRFGGNESGRFINGVLDRIRRDREARAR